MSHPPERRSDRSAEGPQGRRFERRPGGRSEASPARDARRGGPQDRFSSPRRSGRWSSTPANGRRRRFPGAEAGGAGAAERPWGAPPADDARGQRSRQGAGGGSERPWAIRRRPDRAPGGAQPSERRSDRSGERGPEGRLPRGVERSAPASRRPFSAPARPAGPGTRRPERIGRRPSPPPLFQDVRTGPRFGDADAAAAHAESHAPAAPDDLIWGRHSAQAALESGRPIHRIWCTHEMRFSPRFLQLLREAKATGVLVEEVTWARLGQISGGAVHQGIVLQVAAATSLDLQGLIEACRQLGEASLLVAVDGLTDPQNLGAIVRSAEALGAHGMVVPQRRSAGLTGSVAKVAAGALEHLPVARVVNLNRSLETLKQEGYRVIGLASEGSICLEEADLDGPLVLVTGSEADGLSLLTRRSCDQLVRIPLRGATPSLNASVATALLLYEVARRGWMAGLRGAAPAPRLVRPPVPAPEPLPLPSAAAEDAPGLELQEETQAEAQEQPRPALMPADSPSVSLPPPNGSATDAAGQVGVTFDRDISL